MKKTWIILLSIVFILGVVVWNSLFVVDEFQSAIVVEFGKPVRTISNAGLQWKYPFIQNVLLFDKRIRAWDGEPNQIPTRDKKFIWVDTTARWRIGDPLKFYTTVSNENGARRKLDDIIDGITRDVISNVVLIEVVRNTNRELQYSEDFNQEGEEDRVLHEKLTLKTGREKITEQILKESKNNLKDMGIEIIDVLLKRVNYTEEVRQKIYARMSSERKKVAERSRAEGQGERAKILGLMEKEVQVIRSESYRQAEEIKGKADAEAARIYAESYTQDPSFYAFWKTLQNYKDTIDDKTFLLLSTKNEYLKYLKGSK